MDVTVIVNPVSGGGRGQANAERLCRALSEHGAKPEMLCTERAGDAERFARGATAECVVAVGGDGTLNEVVNGLGESDAIVASLPVGTANVVARQLRLPRQPELLAALILQRHTRTMDAGIHRGRRFLLGAGAGLDAAITKRVMSTRGRRSSLWKWVWPAIHTCLTYTFPRIHVEADGVLISDDAQYAIIGNCVYSAGIFPTTPRARIDDGLLDVCLLRNLSVPRMCWLPLKVWRSSFVEHRDITYVQARHIAMRPTAADAVPLQIDGDPAGEVPAEFDVVPCAVQIVAPAIE